MERLSAASQLSLRLQGGAFSPDEYQEFMDGDYADAALRLRHWDDEAKVPGLSTPDLEHFLQYFEAAAAASTTSRRHS